MSKIFYIDGREYFFIKNLSNSNANNIFLLQDSDTLYVYKKLNSQIFDFELYSYNMLKKFKINIPNLIFIDKENKIILREYIQGENIQELIKQKKINQDTLMEIFSISELLNINNFNIDYKPENFIVHDNKLFYTKYVIYPYDESYNFHNYGVYFWITDYTKENFEKPKNQVQKIVDEMYYDYIAWKHNSIY